MYPESNITEQIDLQKIANECYYISHWLCEPTFQNKIFLQTLLKSRNNITEQKNLQRDWILMLLHLTLVVRTHFPKYTFLQTLLKSRTNHQWTNKYTEFFMINLGSNIYPEWNITEQINFQKNCRWVILYLILVVWNKMLVELSYCPNFYPELKNTEQIYTQWWVIR